MTTPKLLLRRLEDSLPSGILRTDASTRAANAGDKWFAAATPDAVAFPKTTGHVRTILEFAHKHRIPVTPRGSGYGYVGGCVPLEGGIALSLARMNRIREVHPRDFVAVVQPGVLTAKLQDAAAALGLFYPPDPASRAESSIGGNIATNAGGPSCLKYGVTRDYVLGLEVVLADGTPLRLGARTHKNKTGFDLARLFVGSEGLLGVVTEATLKLLPLPPYRAALALGFDETTPAIQAIQAVFAAGFLPCALEVADEFTLQAAVRRTGSRRLDGCRSHLIVALDGRERSVRSELDELEALLRGFSPRFVERALGSDETESLWQIRREFSFSLRDTGLIKLNQDIVVPRGRLEDLFRFTARLQKRHGVPLACFGHAGDGNIHVNVMIPDASEESRARADRVLDRLFQQILKWGGAITGEHGVGIAKLPWWPQAVSPAVAAAHRSIKQALDPAGILNPGKFVPAQHPGSPRG